MACNKLQMHELPGSYNSCQVLIVRECLEVNGADIGPGLTSIVTDGVTVQGAGTTLSPVAIKAVQHDGTMTGNGTVASPLSVPAGPPATVVTDNITIQGDGSGGNTIRIKRVQASGMLGSGALGDPLQAVTLSGVGGGVDVSVANQITMTTVDPGNIAIQAQDGAHTGAGALTMVAQGGGGSLGASLGTVSGGPVQLGLVAGDVVQMFPGFVDIKALALSPGVSPAGYARLWYDSTAGALKLSLNGAAFVAVVTL